ncbi:MAG: hypothetical protein HETSPECPRED_008756 [Heterodermia speciosa]|uniref:Cysteine dioxygenase n=1 Tax=Heterodermia speciosa TaxID=116794 RepID=A0A8H3EU07_9LECA|nr:MAG: hypothetical protein HETSPECPRED_008756 [Heterodermia speciosa]
MPSAELIDAWDEVTMPDPDQSTFQRLVKDLSDVLGPSSGLSSADVDVGTIIKLMEDYISDEPNWIKYAFEDANKAFTRNLIDRGNGKSNLILRGSLLEATYDWPDEANRVEGANVGLKKQKEELYTKDQVAYIEDHLGLHKIANPAKDFAVSLHLYTPPNAARDGFWTFDEKTGAQTYIRDYTFHSEMGQRVAQ